MCRPSSCCSSTVGPGARGAGAGPPLGITPLEAGRGALLWGPPTRLRARAGADANAATAQGRATSLHRAAFAGRAAAVRALLQHGADPLLQDADGESALHKAAAQVRGPQRCCLSVSAQPSRRAWAWIAGAVAAVVAAAGCCGSASRSPVGWSDAGAGADGCPPLLPRPPAGARRRGAALAGAGRGCCCAPGPERQAAGGLRSSSWRHQGAAGARGGSCSPT
jgi:hypothetical protein